MIKPETPEQRFAAQIGETLWNAYPGYRWAVAITGGLARIRNLDLSGRWGFDIPLSALDPDPLFKQVVHAGGEILERYRLARGRADGDRLDELPRFITGEAMGDVHA
ncbi:MAG: hypothetical protein HQL76_08815 [Magnetococcales bacterium]|nr:hypothetical protein [Magnetococcales bacterium]